MKFRFTIQRTVLMFALFITIGINNSKAATITTAASGNWSSASTWNISLTRPGTVTVTAGSTSVTGSALASFTTTLSVGSQILNTSNVVIGTVASIQSATTLTLVSGATNSMTNAGWNSRGVGPGDAVSISSGRTVTVDGNYTCISLAMSTVSAQTGVTISGTNALTVNGAITMARPASTAYNCALNIGAGSVTMSSLTMSATTSGRNDIISITTGTCTINGTITSGTTGCQINMTSTGTLEMGGTVGGFTLSPGTTSTVIYDANAAQTVRPVAYNNLNLGGSGSKTTTTVTVNGTLTIEGTATMSAAATFGATAGIRFNTTTARTVTNNEWPATFSGTTGISLTSTGAITLNGAKILGGNCPLTINPFATLNTGNFTLDFGGNFTNNGTFNAGSSSINISGTATTQSISGFNTTGTVTLTKTAGIATFTGNVTAGPLTLNGTAGSLSCGTDNTLTFTKFTRGPGTLLGGSSTINFTDSAFLSTGSFTAETSTVRWISNETAQDISSVTYYNVEFGGSSIKTTYTFTTILNNFTMTGTASTTASANLSIGGDFTIGNGNTYNTAAFNLTVTGTTTIGAGTGGTLAITNATPVITFGNLTLNAGGTLTNTVNDSYTITGTFTNNGNYNSGTGTITFSGTSKSFEGSTQTTFANLDISGSYTLNSDIIYTGTLSGAGSLTMGSTGTLNINSATNPSVTTFDASTSGNTVNYNLAGAQSVLAKTYHHLSFSNSGVKTFAGNTTVSGNFNLNNTADMDGSTFILTFKGDITTNTGATNIVLTNAKIILDGSSTQNITVARNLGFRPKKLFLLNSEKIFTTSSVVISDTLSLASGSILNGKLVTSSVTLGGAISGTGTFKFGSCASPTSAILSINNNTSNIIVPNFESNFNQIVQLIVSLGSNTRTATFNSDVLITTSLFLAGGVATFNGNLALDGDAPINDQTGKINITSSGSLTFGSCVSTGVAYTIPNNIFSAAQTFKNLTINRTNGVTLGNQMISLSDVLTMTAGNLATNGNLTLLSTATNTARVAPITNGSVISGNVTVNRFIPGGSTKRKWRLLSSPVNVSGSIALSQFIDDIFVTAPASTGGGFDASPNNNASIRTYNEATSGASSLGWTNPTNISNTVTTGTGLEVFVRGTRSLANPFLNWTTPDNVTIDYIGTLNTGTIAKSLTYTPSTGGASTADGFNLVGNPYASPINFDTTAGWTKTNIENKFWCYNPNTSNYGIYDAVAHTGTNGITRYIASGQAFFVRATSASAPSISFTENVKCKQIGNSYFKPSKTSSSFPILRMTLIDDSADYDETLILIDSLNGSNLATDERDAAKFFNDALNLYTVTNDKFNLAINSINVPSISDTINVSVWSYDSTNISTKHHKISFSEFESIDPSIELYLFDSYLNVISNIRNNSEYDFMISTDVKSYGNDRFKLIFNNLSIGVSSEIKNDEIVLYPNPANSNLYLKLNNHSTSTLNYEIVDLMGRIIKVNTLEPQNALTQLNIEEINNGTYFIRISQDGKQYIKKFIKQ